MRVDEKLWDKGWYFGIIVTVFGNVINSSTSSTCDAGNVIRFKQKRNKLNKKEAHCKGISTLLYAGQVQKEKKAPGKR